MSHTLKTIRTVSWAAAILWMAFIFFLSSQQTVGIGTTPTSRFFILKFFHLVEYAILFILFRLASGRSKPSFIISYLYALTDELHQVFVPGREGKWLDTLVDLIGMLLGFAVFTLAVRIYPRSKLLKAL